MVILVSVQSINNSIDIDDSRSLLEKDSCGGVCQFVGHLGHTEASRPLVARSGANPRQATRRLLAVASPTPPAL